MTSSRDEQHVRLLIEGSNTVSRLLGMDQLIYGETPVLSPDQAEAAERMVKAWFTSQGAMDSPVMYQPGHEGPMWVLSLEGGPEDWPMLVCEALRDKWPDGVFAEPVAGWCLGLYPA